MACHSSRSWSRRTSSGGIGHQGGLPWHLSDDLKRFKQLTLGKPVVMGRKTWDSIGRPLPGRHNIVVSRQRGLVLEGVTVVPYLAAAWQAAGDVPEICIIGGAEIFRQACPSPTWCIGHWCTPWSTPTPGCRHSTAPSGSKSTETRDRPTQGTRTRSASSHCGAGAKCMTDRDRPSAARWRTEE
jgi:hypothetical protein